VYITGLVFVCFFFQVVRKDCNVGNLYVFCSFSFLFDHISFSELLQVRLYYRKDDFWGWVTRAVLVRSTTRTREKWYTLLIYEWSSEALQNMLRLLCDCLPVSNYCKIV